MRKSLKGGKRAATLCKWVAVVDDKVVAADESLEEVKAIAEEKGYTDFVFHLVPSFSTTYLCAL
jgi:Family of unknown function (DUF5678)